MLGVSDVKSKNVDMLSGSITKGLLTMIVPIMIMNVSQSLFNILDMSLLKVFGFSSAVGAVGASSTLISLCTNLLIGLAAGANVIVANRVGKCQRDRADKAAMTSLLVGLTGGIFMMIIGVVFAKNFLGWINCPDALLSQAARYFQLYFLGLPALMLYNFSASILRAIGDTKRPMYYLIIGGVVKVVSTAIFVLIFNDGVFAVGLAMIVTNVVTFILTFMRLLKSKEHITINFKEIRFDMVELKAILLQGIPAGLQSSFYAFANTLISATVNSFGPAATTGIAISTQFDGLIYQVVYAPSLAIIPFISQNIGAGNIKRVKKTIISGMLITIAFGATFGALSAIFSKQLSSIMSSDPAVIAFSQQKMIIISSLYFICGINEVMGGVLKGMQKPLPPAISSLVFMCGLRFVWIYFIFPLLPNLTFLYAVWPVGWVLSLITLFIIYRINMSRLEKGLAQQE